MYDMHCEPGHKELFEQVKHVDLKDYQPGAPHYERLQEQMEQSQRFTFPSEYQVNF